MGTLADLLADEFHQQATNTLRYDANLQKELLYFLLILQEFIASEITKNRFMFSRTEPNKQTRLKQLIKTIYSEIDNTYDDIEGHLQNAANELLPILYKSTEDSINTAFSGELIKNKEYLSEFNSLMVGASLTDWVTRQAIDFKRRISDQLNLALIGNENLEEVLNRVLGVPSSLSFKVKNPDTEEEEVVYVPTGGVINTAFNSVRTLAKTAVQAVANLARLSVFKANPELIKGMEALVTLDNRTSDLCRGRSGYQWLMSGEPIPPTPIRFPGSPPWHANCRTIIIPVFFTKTELQALTGNQLILINTLQVDDDLDAPVSKGNTYEGWLERQPISKQKQILGNVKYELWKDGKITLPDMVNQNGNPLTLEELKNENNNSN